MLVGEPRCPKCGYTATDAAIHCDHDLCDGVIPGRPESLVLRMVDAIKVLEDGIRINSGVLPVDACERAREILRGKS